MKLKIRSIRKHTEPKSEKPDLVAVDVYTEATEEVRHEGHGTFYFTWEEGKYLSLDDEVKL